MPCNNYFHQMALATRRERSSPTTLRGKRVPKRCPWGTIATNGTLFSLIIMIMEKRVPFRDRGIIHKNSAPRGIMFMKQYPWATRGTKIVPLRLPYYGQSNGAPRCTSLVFSFAYISIFLAAHINPVYTLV